MNTKPLILMALPDEAHGYFDQENIRYTGCGKINAAYHLTKAITSERPKQVINLGSAGSPTFPAGTLVNCIRFIQRDMDVSALGFAKGETPFDDLGPVLDYGQSIPGLVQGTCGTGDSFVTEGQTQTCEVLDMEAYALARICQREAIPFTCVKYISDGADGQAAQDWQKNLAQGAQKFFQLYREKLLNYFCQKSILTPIMEKE